MNLVQVLHSQTVSVNKLQEPMNIFQGSHHNPNPIRLSYHRGNHYNAVVPITDEEFVVPPTSFGKFNSIPGTQ